MILYPIAGDTKGGRDPPKVARKKYEIKFGQNNVTRGPRHAEIYPNDRDLNPIIGVWYGKGA